MNGDDGWFTVDRYLDTAKMAGVHSVRIIHGKGTGALRKALWVYFKSDSRVTEGEFVQVKLRRVLDYDLYGVRVTK